MRWTVDHERLLQKVNALSKEPGVYRFFDAQGDLLYVGKAKNLKARVSSYFQGSSDQPKVNAMVQRIHGLETTLTASELEALLLEFNLIKAHRPPYNILLKDGKSYPYLFLSDDDFPRLVVHRGPHKALGQYFGPYPNVRSVYEVLSGLQKIGQLRNCTEGYFKSRKRPCLQYQIRRCSAPCVKLVDKQTYQNTVKQVADVLLSKDESLLKNLVSQMQHASQELNYEKAAEVRDLIAAIQNLRMPQGVVTKQGDVDVVALKHDGLQHCCVVMMIRAGKLLGHRAFFPKVPHEMAVPNVMYQFLLQHYLDIPSSGTFPKQIITNVPLQEQSSLSVALSKHVGRSIQVILPGRSSLKTEWIQIAEKNAQEALKQQLHSQNSLFQRFEHLTHCLKNDVLIERIDCFDISHFQGEATIGACVACGLDGPIKSDYRRYGVKGLQKGDDYGALLQVLKRHYGKQGHTLPDIILIDGGKGQLHQAEKMAEALDLTDVFLMSIAKGASRKPGLELVYVSGRSEPLYLQADSEALHLLQFVRDEAHRFAITGHRQKRDKRALTSVLEKIEGIGKAKRQALLEHFDGLQGISQASVKNLAQVPGIGPELAKKISDYLKKQY